MSYDFSQTLNELDAGIFSAKLSAAVHQTALAVIEQDKQIGCAL